MSDGEALLAAIMAQPDEDTPRLAYADWLDEQGEHAKAEFVRIQVAGSRINVPGVCHRVDGRRGHPVRFKHLIDIEPWKLPNVASALAISPGWYQATNSTAAVLWRRGFVEAVFLSSTSLGPVTDRLKRHPIREVRLSGWSPNPLLPPGNPFVVSPVLAEAELRLSLQRAFPAVIRATYDMSRPGAKTCPFDIVRGPSWREPK